LTTYVHRSGRTARAGAEGFSLSVNSKGEVAGDIADLKRSWEKILKRIPKGGVPKVSKEQCLDLARTKIFKTKPTEVFPRSLGKKLRTASHSLNQERS